MAKYICSICGYIYDETTGNPEHIIPPGTKWKDLPNKWVCPIFGNIEKVRPEKCSICGIPGDRFIKY